MDRRTFITAAGAAALLPGGARAAETSAWLKLPTEPYRGKQDDVFFVDESVGWYGNGGGKLYKTLDGGQTWTRQLDRAGSFVRALGFVDEHLGFFGNIGPGYFPNVTDEVPLYRTRNGGDVWEPVAISGPQIAGICAINVFKEPVINAGTLDHRVVLRTADGGQTWSAVHEGRRPFELTWKMSWPSEQVGYVTVQSYDPAASASRRYVAKSTDGGLTWTERLLVDDARVREFGVGFVDEQFGWVGAAPHGFETRDGGDTWTPAAMGAAVNKIRVVPGRQGGCAVFAIGVELHRRDIAAGGC